MAHDLSAFVPQFTAEAREHIQAITDGILQLEKQPQRREVIRECLRHAHTIKGGARMLGMEPIVVLAHEIENLFENILWSERALTPALNDMLLRAIDELTRLTRQAEARLPLIADNAILQQLRVPDDPETNALPVMPSELAMLPAIASAVVEVPEPPAALLSAPALKGETIRVSLKRVDHLMSLIGELTYSQLQATDLLERLQAISREANLMRSGGQLAVARTLDNLSNQFIRYTDDLHILVEELQGEVLSLSTVPLATVFRAFPRAVRDLAREHHKEINFVIEGAETVLDRQIVEQLSDPLIHLLHNAVDHGIELPSVREQRGKPRQATIRLQAHRAGPRVMITVSDDGMGVHPDILVERALARGVISYSQAAQFSEAEKLNLIFYDGVSTRREVSEISGRGVGMGAVKRSVERMRGQLRFTTRIGEGTAFELDLPLTLAIVHGVLFECAGQTFALPTDEVLGALQLQSSDWTRREPEARAAATLVFEEERIPFVPLREVLNLPLTLPTRANGHRHFIALVLDGADTKVAVQVDRLLAEQELVVKPLSTLLQDWPFLSGASVLGDGRLILILEAKALVKAVQSQRYVIPELPPPRPKPHVLVVDDSRTTREVLQSIFQASGYQVGTAVDGLDALAQMARQPYDVVIVDIEMPRMHGFELIETLRSRSETRMLPLVIITARTNEADRQRALEAGADAYVVKSAFDQNDLLTTVERLLSV